MISTRTLFFHLTLYFEVDAEIVFDAQALLKNQKMALLVVLRGSFLGVIGTLLFNESLVLFEGEGFILVILILQAITKEFYFYQGSGTFFIYY